jgi:hypothetical protein
MYWFWSALLIGVQLLCAALLWFSGFPGMNANLLLIAFAVVYVILYYGWFLVGALIVINGGILLWHHYRQKHSHRLRQRSFRQSRKRRFPTKLALVTVSLIFLTSIVGTLNVPKKILFSLSRSDFDAFVNNAALVKAQCLPVMKQKLGWYLVEGCDVDPRGGIYFKTGSENLILDSVSYGFVYQPNREGSREFGDLDGDLDYDHYPLTGSWYWFRAERDWL